MAIITSLSSAQSAMAWPRRQKSLVCRVFFLSLVALVGNNSLISKQLLCLSKIR
jgi:hypothetical protein